MAKYTGIRTYRGRIRVQIDWQNKRIQPYYPGDSTEDNKRAASKLRKQILTDLQDGTVAFSKIKETYFTKNKKAPRIKGTLYDVFLHWEEYCKPLKNKRKGYKKTTLTSVSQCIRNRWMPVFGKRRMTDISYDEVYDFLWSDKWSHLDVKTLKNWNTYLTRMYVHAYKNMKIRCKPFPTSEMIYPDERIDPSLKIIFPYSPEEVELLINHIVENCPLDIQLYFVLFRGLGLRPCEILALEETDIDGDYVFINKGMTQNEIVAPKNWKGRQVYIQPQVMEVLQRYLATKKVSSLYKSGQTNYIFTNESGKHHCDARRFNEAWTKAHKEVKLSKADADRLYNTHRRELLALDQKALENDERLTPYLNLEIPKRDAYKLRHTRASELISSGAAEEGPGELGHDPVMFYQIYAKQIQAYKNKDREAERKKKLTSVVKIS